MIKSHFFKGLLISVIAASSMYAKDVALVLESTNTKAPMWKQVSGTDTFKLVSFPARVELTQFSAIDSFQIVNATPLSATHPREGYKATIEAGVLTKIVDLKNNNVDVTADVKELMFIDGTKLKGNNPYYIGSTTEEIAVKIVFKTKSSVAFDLTDDADSDGVANGEDYCPFTAGVTTTEYTVNASANGSVKRNLREVSCTTNPLTGAEVCTGTADTTEDTATVTTTGTDATTTGTDATTTGTDATTTGTDATTSVALLGCPAIEVATTSTTTGGDTTGGDTTGGDTTGTTCTTNPLTGAEVCTGTGDTTGGDTTGTTCTTNPLTGAEVCS